MAGMFRFSCERGARSTCKLCTLFFRSPAINVKLNFLIDRSVQRNVVPEKLFWRNGYFFFFFCRGNAHTIASNGSRIDRIANSAHRVNISYRTDRRMVENISFFMRKGGALDTVRKLSNALGL